MAKPVKIMETVLRDGHQSLCATRMHLSDMLPQLAALDQVGIGGQRGFELGYGFSVLVLALQVLAPESAAHSACGQGQHQRQDAFGGIHRPGPQLR